MIRYSHDVKEQGHRSENGKDPWKGERRMVMQAVLWKRERRSGKGASWLRLLAVLRMAVSLLALPAWADSDLSAAADRALGIKETDYESKGKVEVNFNQYVRYKNVKIKVKDSAGKKVSASITEKDGDELDFRVRNCRMGETYTFTISGVSKRAEKKYQTLKGKIYIPVVNGNVPVKAIEYDEKDREVDFSFAKAVQWKSVRVEITDGKKKYSVKITDKDMKDLEVRVKKLKKDKVYRFTISGIRKKGDTEFTKISGSFAA